ncbi:hypothetical protein QH73_0013300 [Scytonema millei VB511283]|uniref:Uncharacterized protein n=1 Tax=Scytonema millei VB511283 TaxID=1245923 RepID=A0A9X5I5M8_9CYAN|nr:hypothetical protein [Scytonema millei VB511283]
MLHATFAFSIPGISYQLSVNREQGAGSREQGECSDFPKIFFIKNL